MQQKKIKPLPVQVYFATVLLLVFAGIAVSSYLTFSHYRVYTDIEYKSFCAISKAINCDTVSQSKYALFIGVPVAVWGIFGHLFMLAALFFSIDMKKKKMRVLSTLFAIALLFSFVSLYLGIISSALIHAYCIMCIAGWIINFALLYMFWLIRRRYETIHFFNSFKNDLNFWKEQKTKTVPALTLFFILTISLISFYPDYWNYTLPHDTEKINTGITEDGHPWIGARNPELTIIEFSDYLCFQCKKMHFFLRNIVSSSSERLRLVHRNFPMDHRFNPIVKGSFHNGAGILALIAISAVEQNRFWETNDYLYRYDLSEGAIYLRKIAEDLNTDLQKLQQNINNKSTRVKLTKDIIFGIKHKFEGTPVYIINDQVYTGQIPLNIIQSLKK